MATTGKNLEVDKGPRFLRKWWNETVIFILRPWLPILTPHWRQTPEGMVLMLPEEYEEDVFPFKVTVYGSSGNDRWYMSVEPGQIIRWQFSYSTTPTPLTAPLEIVPSLADEQGTTVGQLDDTSQPIIKIKDDWWGETVYLVGELFTIQPTGGDTSLTASATDSNSDTFSIGYTAWQYTSWKVQVVKSADIDTDNYVYFTLYDLPSGPGNQDGKQYWKSDMVIPYYAFGEPV